eukprot:GDKJ01003842.1.p1 GENE.GDKJ01003842.1~~GDKJ01003842.1.p1  ORF type:complete len:180 (-),score=16.81 GDKJ01003842.1:50-589(-)
MDYYFEGNSLNIIAQHCVKHMAHSVFGILVGHVVDRKVNVVSAIPVCHRPMFPATFSIVMQTIEQGLPKTLRVVGGYHIHVSGSVNLLPESIKAFGSKIKENVPGGSGHIFEINAKKLSVQERCIFSNEVSDSHIHISEETLDTCLDGIKSKEYLSLSDFDEFFHDPEHHDPMKNLPEN